MRKVILVAAAAVLLACPDVASAVTPIGAGGGATAVVADPSNQCADGLDNDGDGKIDGGDRGCSDDTPTTEGYSGPLTRLTIADAVAVAKMVTISRVGNWWDRVTLTKNLCHRLTPTRVRCNVLWRPSEGTTGAMTIRVFHYLDYVAQAVGVGTRVEHKKAPRHS